MSNILDSDAQALVNTVNCVGVMGKGLALQFRRRYPEMYEGYKLLCDRGLIRPGRMDIHFGDYIPDGKVIINFPVKYHWRNPSQLSYIKDGLQDLRRILQGPLGITSIAIPPLGCGLGGLDWSDVEPLIHDALDDLPVEVTLYPPAR